MNSSPPKRATVSSGRSVRWMRAATSRSTSSPARVPEAVVDPLEAVHVEEVDGGGLAAPAPLDRVAQAVGEERAVGQAGERVVQREPLELGLHALAVRHVEEDAVEERSTPCRRRRAPRSSRRGSRSQLPSARLIRYSCTSASPELAQSASLEITRSASSGCSSRSQSPPSSIQCSWREAEHPLDRRADVEALAVDAGLVDVGDGRHPLGEGPVSGLDLAAGSPSDPCDIPILIGSKPRLPIA